jgi:hypothetical protein
MGPPAWWSETNKRKVLDGIIAVDSCGTAVMSGGHRAGREWPNKTEFPAAWTESDVDRAVALAWLDPDVEKVVGDRRVVRRLFDGVVVEVSAWGNNFERFRAAFPKSGIGVYLNHPDAGKVALALDRGSLEERGRKRRAERL